MKTRTSIPLPSFLAVVFFLTGIQIYAATIFVPNGSFESQVAGPPYGVDNRIDSWQKSPKPFWFDESSGFTWDQTMGVFANTPVGAFDHIDNMAGNQGLYLFSFPQVAVFQDYNTTDWNHTTPTHDFNTIFEAGHSYQLTVGVLGGGGPMAVGSMFEISLYYRDANNNMVTIGATPITYTTDVFPNHTHFVDFQVDLAEVQAGDAWAGKNIGIQLASLNGSGGYWDLDNVRLTSAVPEPASIALAGLAGMALALRLRIGKLKA